MYHPANGGVFKRSRCRPVSAPLSFLDEGEGQSMIVNLGSSLDRIQDLRHSVRRLSRFQETFCEIVDEVRARFGYSFQVSERRLAGAFLNWAEAFSRERGHSAIDRRDFVVYSGGLMLKQLIQAAPAELGAGRKPAARLSADPLAAIVEFWPEGFLYTYYCLTVVSSILETDFEETVSIAPSFEELRVWQSFRENVKADSAIAVSFFDMFLGREPNWAFPDSLLSRPVIRQAQAPALQRGY
jgi:hypothetical protein